MTEEDYARDLKKAKKLVASLTSKTPIWWAIRLLINEQAGLVKHRIKVTDYSGHEHACGRALGIMDGLEYVIDLPKLCSSQAPKEKEK